MTPAPVNDNAAPGAGACPYGPLGTVLVHHPQHAAFPYRRLTRFPGVVIEHGYATPQQAVAGPPALAVAGRGEAAGAGAP